MSSCIRGFYFSLELKQFWCWCYPLCIRWYHRLNGAGVLFSQEGWLLVLCSFSESVFISSYLLISEKQEVSGMVGFVCENSSDVSHNRCWLVYIMPACHRKFILCTVSVIIHYIFSILFLLIWALTLSALHSFTCATNLSDVSIFQNLDIQKKTTASNVPIVATDVITSLSLTGNRDWVLCIEYEVFI